MIAVSWEQLPLFPSELYHVPTAAELRRETFVVMCMECGALVALAERRKLGDCPACGHDKWKRQPTEVGPFRMVE